MRLKLYNASSKTGRRRKAPRRDWLKPVMLTTAVIAVGLAGFAGWLWRDTIRHEAIMLTADAGLRLERIELAGRLNTERDAIMRKAGLEWYMPMLTIDLEGAHDRLMQIGWVGGVRVEKRLPSTLVITLDERTALALFQDDNGHHVVDRKGRIIEDVAPENFTHLPVLKGAGAARNAGAILAMLKEQPDLYGQVWSLTYQSERRWDVFLRNNIRIQLPETDARAAWTQLAEMDRQHKLTERDVVNIDLRIPGKLVIRTGDAATETGTRGSKT